MKLEAFAERLKNRRIFCSMTQNELAEAKLGGRATDKLHTFYTGGRDAIAAFAPVAFEAARAGDAAAYKIIEQSMSGLAELITAADNSSETVIVSGGLTSEREIIEPILKSRLPKKMKLVFPTLPQIYGAAVAAMKYSCCRTDAAEFDRNFTEDYTRISGRNAETTSPISTRAKA